MVEHDVEPLRRNDVPTSCTHKRPPKQCDFQSERFHEVNDFLARSEVVSMAADGRV